MQRTSALKVRLYATWFVLLTLIAGTAWSMMGSRLPPADFTFVNHTEVKSFDPAIITGQPEGNIADALFEGLTRWHPETLEPLPAVAKSWDISDDQRTYTFHLRADARWSDGSSVTADDFRYSLRRFLGPRTAAEYAYLGWYIKNARRYSIGSRHLRPGDLVEVELNLPVDATNTRRGKLLRGKLVALEHGRAYVVDFEGRQQRFVTTDDDDASENNPPADARWCRQVLLDFHEVGVEVVDSLTLRITLENPTPYFLKLVGFYPMFPVNQKCVETYGSPQWTKPKNLVSNGPYNVQFRRIRDRIRLVRSETYWDRENVKLKVIDALATDSLSTALNLYLTDKADWINRPPPAALRILLDEDPPRDDLNPAPYLGIYFYLLNTTRKPLDDVRVRRALSLALSRAEITERILRAGELPSLNFVPPGIPGYRGQMTAAENPDEARRLLAEAGYPEGKGFPQLDILYNTDEAHQSVAELIRKQWQKQLGISVKTRNEEWASYQSSQRTMQYNICRRAWIGDYVDPNTFLDMFVTGGEQNSTGWGNPEYDRLIERARREVDPDKRLRVLESAEKLLMEEVPILPIYFYVSRNMVKPHIRGFYNNLQDHHPLSSMWIDRESTEPNEFMRGRP